VYGSDALAGVVNIRLRDEFDGVEFEGGYGLTEDGDGASYDAGISAGLPFADGRGHVIGYLGYSDRAPVNFDDRAYSSYALGYVGPDAGGVGPGGAFLADGSPNIEEGSVNLGGGVASRPSFQAAFDNLFVGYGYAPGEVPLQTRFGFNADRTLFTTGNGPEPLVANFRGERDPLLFNPQFYSYNFAPFNYLQLPLERTSAFVRGKFEFTDSAEAFAQLLWSDYRADTQLAPTPINPFFRVPVTNPYVPDDLKLLLQTRPAPAAPFNLQKRLSELGPRFSANEYDVYQATIGLRGDAFERWSYDVYLQYGENELVQTQQRNTTLLRLEELTFAADGGVALCGGFDPFGPGSISDECATFLAVDAKNRQGYEQTVAEASLTGPLFDLPAGSAQAVFGIVHKRDESYYLADPQGGVFLADGRPNLQGFNTSDDVSGEDDNTDLYVELLLPLFGGAEGRQSLEAVVGYRYADYASIGGIDAYKAELLYLPVERLRLRGSYQHAVRAPSVLELYEPQLPFITEVGPFGLLDPCTAGSAQRTGSDGVAVEAMCVAQGVPAELLADFSPPADTIQGVAGGNPELTQEQADTLTLGFVLQSWSGSPWLERMSLAVDWYRIEIEESIDVVGSDVYVPGCYDPAYNPRFDVGQEYCSYFARDPVDGGIIDLADIYRNLALRETSGVDVQIDWLLPAGPGDLNLNLVLSWLDYLNSRIVEGAAKDRYAGTLGQFGGSAPEWQSNLTLDYSWRDFGVTLQWRYIDSMLRPPVLEGGPSNFVVPSYDYFDLSLRHEFAEGILGGLALTFGVENLTDENPPIFPSPVAANTDPSRYDTLGRRYYVNLKYRF
jgi:outer membrane receptor protein involved in Fe transport